MILTYHNIVEKSIDWMNVNYNTVDLKHFEMQLKSLENKQFVYLNEYDTNNPNHVVLRFDDGYKGVIKYALPVLKKYQLPFEVFVTDIYTREAENGNEQFMNCRDLQELVKNGGRLEYHTKSHLNLTQIYSNRKLKQELFVPYYLKKIDKNGFNYLAYPYWEFNNAVIEIVKEFYKGALTVRGLGDNSAYQLESIRVDNFMRKIENMPKKVAIQLFGHLRTFKDTYELFKKNLIDKLKAENYDVDIFIHTWDRMDHSTYTYKMDIAQNFSKISDITNEIINYVRKIYNPKIIKIESQIILDEKLLTQYNGYKRSINACLNPVYSIYQGSKIRQEYEKENSIIYDWVIVTRPDILFEMPFSINRFLKCYEDYDWPINKNAIYYANNPFDRGNELDEWKFARGTDLIYFGTSQNIDKAALLYENFDNYIKEFRGMESWIMSWWLHVDLKPIPLLYKCGQHFDILRENSAISLRLFDKQKEEQACFLYLKKGLLSLLPYFIVQSKIKKIKNKLSKGE